MPQETPQVPLTVEARFAALEAEVAALKQRLDKFERKGWVERFVGSAKDVPDFEEVVRYGREARQAQPSSEEVPG